MTQQIHLEQEAAQEQQARQLQETDSSENYEEWSADEVEAERTPLQSNAEEVERMAEAIHTESRKRKQAFQVVLGGTLLFSIFMALLRFMLGRDALLGLLIHPGFLAGFFSIMLVIGLICIAMSNPRRTVRKATTSLAGQDDISAIGPLLDSLKLEDSEGQRKVIDGLTRLLPRLKSNDATLLNANQRAKLYMVLNQPTENPLYKDIKDLFKPAVDYKTDFRVAILKALEQVGDHLALPIVERRARSAAKTEAEIKIRDAAQSCLPFLQARVQQERAMQTLLRASSSGTFPAELLRPSAEVQTVADQLLRPAEE